MVTVVLGKAPGLGTLLVHTVMLADLLAGVIGNSSQGYCHFVNNYQCFQSFPELLISNGKQQLHMYYNMNIWTEK